MTRHMTCIINIHTAHTVHGPANLTPASANKCVRRAHGRVHAYTCAHNTHTRVQRARIHVHTRHGRVARTDVQRTRGGAERVRTRRGSDGSVVVQGVWAVREEGGQGADATVQGVWAVREEGGQGADAPRVRMVLRFNGPGPGCPCLGRRLLPLGYRPARSGHGCPPRHLRRRGHRLARGGGRVRRWRFPRFRRLAPRSPCSPLWSPFSLTLFLLPLSPLSSLAPSLTTLFGLPSPCLHPSLPHSLTTSLSSLASLPPSLPLFCSFSTPHSVQVRWSNVKPSPFWSSLPS